MTRTNLAALALLAGVTIAAPAVICSAADSEMQTAQAQTTAQPPSDQPAQDTPGMGGMERQLCDKLPAEAGSQGQGTILDRMSRREQFLQARLQAMQQTRPALEALYNALTPEQQAVVDHPFRR